MNYTDWIQQHGETLQVVLFFSLFPALAVLERLIPRRPATADRRERWRANLRLTLVNIVVILSLPVSFIMAALWAEAQGWGLLNLPGVPASLGLLATLLLRGFISWGTHLLNHKVPVLWRFHRVHHLDTELDVSSTVRFHPIEFVLSLIMGLPLVVVFGLTPWALVLYEVLDATVTLFSHSNLRVPASIDRVLKYIIVTPDLHRIHHSSWQPETDSNYSAVFPVWDLLMGTFRGSPREAHATMILGLDEVRDRRSHQALWLLTSPFRRHFPGDPEPELSPASMNA